MRIAKCKLCATEYPKNMWAFSYAIKKDRMVRHFCSEKCLAQYHARCGALILAGIAVLCIAVIGICMWIVKTETRSLPKRASAPSELWRQHTAPQAILSVTEFDVCDEGVKYVA